MNFILYIYAIYIIYFIFSTPWCLILLLFYDLKQHNFVVGCQCIGPTFMDNAVHNRLTLAGETEKSS
jgi:hypothetical protein